MLSVNLSSPVDAEPDNSHYNPAHGHDELETDSQDDGTLLDTIQLSIYLLYF